MEAVGGQTGRQFVPANTLRSESVNHNNGLDVLKRKLLNTNSGGSSAQRCLEGGAVALRPRWWVFSKGDKKIAKVHSCRCPRKRILVNNKCLGSHTFQTFGPSMIHVRCCRCCCCATVLLDKSAATDGSTAMTDYWPCAMIGGWLVSLLRCQSNSCRCCVFLKTGALPTHIK